MPLYDIQVVVKDKNGVPGLKTDTVTTSKWYIFRRVQELNKPSRKQHVRVVDRLGRPLSPEELRDMR